MLETNSRSTVRSALAVLMAFALAGCSTASEVAISDRAVQYNLDAEQVEDRQVLLNIVRAAFEAPPEFTTLQNLTGQSSVSGTAGLTLPLRKGVPPKGVAATSATLLNLGTTLSVTPQFTMGVIDTQEFYNGILKPVDLATVDLYYKRRYSPTLVFNLFFREITVTQKSDDPHQADKILLVENSASPEYGHSGDELKHFQRLVDYLLNLGLTTAAKKQPIVGAPLLPNELDDVAQFARAANAGLDVIGDAWCDLSEKEQRVVLEKKGKSKVVLEEAGKKSNIYDYFSEKCKEIAKSRTWKQKDDLTKSLNSLLISQDLPTVLYRAQKSGQRSFTLCFSTPPFYSTLAEGDVEKQTIDGIASTLSACTKRPLDAKIKLTPAQNAALHSKEELGGTSTGEVVLGQTANDIFYSKDGKPGQPSSTEINFTQPVILQFTPRSPEGIIYYLGEIVRRQLPGDNYLEIKYGPPDERIPEEDAQCSKTNYKCNERIFVFDDLGALGRLWGGPNAPYSSLLEVSYNGNYFATPNLVDKRGQPNVSPTGAGRTFQVLSMVRQLIGMQRSAKDLPVSNVYTLITP